MSYDLTIDRVGTLVPSSPGSSSPNISKIQETATNFRLLANKLRVQLDGSMDQVLDAAKEADATAVKWIRKSRDSEFDDDDDFIDIVRKNSPRDEDGQPPLLALFPSRRLRLTLSGLSWVVRTRPTVTSCALQKTAEPTKLWWTFEGIPEPTGKEPNERDSAKFIDLTGALSKVAMPLLNKAYWTAFETVTGRRPSGFGAEKKMVRVCMADANTREMAALVDAFARKGAIASDIRGSDDPTLADAREGMMRLDSFVSSVVNKNGGWVPPDASIEVSELLRGARGILSRQSSSDDDTFLIGFARRLGSRVSASLLSDDLRAQTRTEPYLRAISAARPLSARIADKEAIKLGTRPVKRKTERLSA